MADDARHKQALNRAEDLINDAERMERSIGTAGAVILLGLLVSEGLHAIAAQIQSAAEAIDDIGGSVQHVADAISAHP